MNVNTLLTTVLREKLPHSWGRWIARTPFGVLLSEATGRANRGTRELRYGPEYARMNIAAGRAVIACGETAVRAAQ